MKLKPINKNQNLVLSKSNGLAFIPDVTQMRPFKPIPFDTSPPFGIFIIL